MSRKYNSLGFKDCLRITFAILMGWVVMASIVLLFVWYRAPQGVRVTEVSHGTPVVTFNGNVIRASATPTKPSFGLTPANKHGKTPHNK